MWPCLPSRVAAATGLSCPPRSVTRLSAKPLRFAQPVVLGARPDLLALPVVKLDPQPAMARTAAPAVRHRLDKRIPKDRRICDNATPAIGVRHVQLHHHVARGSRAVLAQIPDPDVCFSRPPD